MIQFLTLMIQGQKAKMDERGASAVEYGLLVAGIAALVAAVVFLLGDAVSDMFTEVTDEINNGTP